MAEQDLVGKVIKWIEESGFPLEMRVARQFRTAKPHLLTQSDKYFDSNARKLREVDLTATWTGIGSGKRWVQVNVVVECKAADKVWILFVDENDTLLDELGAEAWIAWMPKAAPDDDISERIEDSVVDSNPRLLANIYPAYGIVQLPKSASNDRDWAYDAVRQVISATHALVAKAAQEHESDYTCTIPVVVTTCPLFRCGLDAEGALAVSPTTRETLVTRSDDGNRFVLVHIVHEDALPEFIGECATLANAFFLPTEAVEWYDPH